MPTVELSCRQCGGETEDNTWAVTTQGQRMPLMYCPLCRKPLVDTEGGDTPATQGNASSANPCQREGCGGLAKVGKSWAKYCSDRCRWLVYAKKHKKLAEEGEK